MTSDFLIDSFAWIEYFRGTKEGEKVKRLLENFRCFTHTVVIAELSDKYSRENYSFWSQDLQFISENSVLLNLDMQTASEAGKIKQLVRKKYKNKFGLVDAIILATAKKMNAKVVTGDKHFKPLENVEFL